MGLLGDLFHSGSSDPSSPMPGPMGQPEAVGSARPSIPPPFQGGGNLPVQQPPPGAPPQGRLQLPQGMSPNSIPGGPATSWRPQSAGQMLSQANQMLQNDTYENLQKSNPQFQKIIGNLGSNLFKWVPPSSHENIIRNTVDLRQQLGNQTMSTNQTPTAPLQSPQQPPASLAPGQSFVPGVPASAQQLPQKFTFDTIKQQGYAMSNANLNKVNPDLLDAAGNIIKNLRAQGFDAVIHNGMRTPEEAAANAASGVGIKHSQHVIGNAVDIIDKRYGWDGPQDKIKAFRSAYAKEIMKYPQLRWGGNWKKYGELGDWAHIEIHQ